MMRKLLLLVGIVAISFASDGSEATDFIPRVVNFVIFAGILWYLLADKVKAFYSNRSNSIADAFNEVQQKLKEAKAKKEENEKRVEETHKTVEDMLKTAKEEAERTKEKILKNAEREVFNLEKSFEEYKELETNKMKKEVVKEHMEKLLADTKLSSKEYADIILKKVS